MIQREPLRSRRNASCAEAPGVSNHACGISANEKSTINDAPPRPASRLDSSARRRPHGRHAPPRHRRGHASLRAGGRLRRSCRTLALALSRLPFPDGRHQRRWPHRRACGRHQVHPLRPAGGAPALHFQGLQRPLHPPPVDGFAAQPSARRLPFRAHRRPAARAHHRA